ncbi:MAG TPA: hypothetical protein VFG54_13710 [Prolixibacteraceae bacterium]|nr:hypothetical protein [Prolixibacteraceae bacterium]
MIANSLILPTEQSIDIHDIKRALLTYDKIYIPSPDDRELLPPNTYQNALMASLGFPTMPMGIPDGPIKPLGKTENYDEIFEKVINECKDAISQGSIEILGTPQYEESITILGAPIPEDTPNPFFTYMNYRQISENPEFVQLMSKGLEKLNLNNVKDISKLIPSGRESEEQSINDIKRPPKALLNIEGVDKDSIQVLSNLCHTRIGTLVKYLGYSFNKQLHPFTSDLGYANVISKLEFNFIGTIDSIQSDEELLKKQKRLATLHNLIVSEYIDPVKIDNLKINQILKQRTKAWGKTQENRSKLIFELNEIALDCDTDSKFERVCNVKFKDFLKVASDYQHEVDKLRIMLLFDANLFFFMKGQNYMLFEKILKAPSIETLLIVGALGIQLAKQHLTAVLDIVKKAEERREATGYAIYSNYRYLLK